MRRTFKDIKGNHIGMEGHYDMKGNPVLIPVGTFDVKGSLIEDVAILESTSGETLIPFPPTPPVTISRIVTLSGKYITTISGKYIIPAN